MADIKIREQAGTDNGRKFDYQMAVALDYLLTEIDNDAIVLIETLEDFAVFHNYGTDFEKVDIYQVKTKNSGLYTKNLLCEDNVLGKIILTDFYFNSQANTLNIICNTHLKGTSTESLECFNFDKTLTSLELTKLKNNVLEYLKKEPYFKKKDMSEYLGKLIYIKSALPFSGNQDRYSETLVGKINNAISNYLDDENHSINPQAICNTLKLLIDRQRRNRFASDTIDIGKAIELKGINTSTVKSIIDHAAELSLSKKEILHHASIIYSPKEFTRIKEEYAQFLSYKANLSDKVFLEAKNIVEEEYRQVTLQFGSMDEVARNVALNCIDKIPYYTIAIIQILTILVIYS